MLELTSGRRGGGNLPPEAIKEASERRAAVLAARSELFGAGLHESIQCYPHDVVIARIAVLGMSAAAKVMLTPAESFALLARASKLVSLTVDRGWTSDLAAQVGFLSLGARQQWVHDNGGRKIARVSSVSRQVGECPQRRDRNCCAQVSHCPSTHY